MKLEETDTGAGETSQLLEARLTTKKVKIRTDSEPQTIVKVFLVVMFTFKVVLVVLLF